jgi:hypothetical protein
MTQEKVQDPRKVDTLIGWVIIAGMAMVLVPVLTRNIIPYETTITNLASEVNAVFRWILRIPGVGWLIGAMVFSAVQAAEVWPVLSDKKYADKTYQEWARKLRLKWLLACIAYSIDLFMCLKYWPILKNNIDVQQLIVGFRFDMVDWGNLGQTALTLFGCTIFILLYRAIGRAA